MAQTQFFRALRFCLLYLPFIFIVSGFQNKAEAVPSFARQTHMACNACHIGGMGPQLTPYGRQFKMEGYTAGDSPSWYVPVSGMAVASFTHTAADQPGGAGSHDKPNDNFAVDQVSLFLAGKLSEHVGIFAQGTYSEVDRHTAMDNFDLRYANHITLGGKDAIIGVALTNNPTVQDAGNTLPSWQFPFISSSLTPERNADPLLAGGLAQQVIGLSTYLYFNDSIYAELGVYRPLSYGFLQDIGVDSSAGNITGIAPYGRLTYTKDLNGNPVSVGLVALHAAILPGRIEGLSDKYTDLGLDASYHILANSKHAITVNGAFIHEWQTLDATFANEASENVSNHLNSFKIDGSYYYDDSYGLTAQYFNIWGNRDLGLYQPEDIAGSRTGKANSTGLVLQADWTPFGKDASWLQPWANLRLGVQYTAYLTFNGAKNNYDGSGRNASDNNTLYLFVWNAF